MVCCDDGEGTGDVTEGTGDVDVRGVGTGDSKVVCCDEGEGTGDVTEGTGDVDVGGVGLGKGLGSGIRGEYKWREDDGETVDGCV